MLSLLGKAGTGAGVAAAVDVGAVDMVEVGRDVTFEQLRRDHAAVVIAVGAKRSRSLGLPGERGPRVYGGVDLLRAVSLQEPIDLGQDAVVIGGGNVAYDVARTVLRHIAQDTARAAARRRRRPASRRHLRRPALQAIAPPRPHRAPARRCG